MDLLAHDQLINVNITFLCLLHQSVGSQTVKRTKFFFTFQSEILYLMICLISSYRCTNRPSIRYVRRIDIWYGGEYWQTVIYHPYRSPIGPVRIAHIRQYIVVWRTLLYLRCPHFLCTLESSFFYQSHCGLLQLHVADLRDKMTGVSLYGVVTNIDKEINNSDTVYSVRIEDTTGAVVAKLHFVRYW